MSSKKEIDDAPMSDELTIDQLPNEILLLIFRNLDFEQLLQATTVSHRWNELAFFLLQKHVSIKFKPEAFWNTDQWTPNRIYEKMSSSAAYLHKDFDGARFRLMVKDVKELKCFFMEAHDGGLLNFLCPFEPVETLELNVGRLKVGKTLQSFVRLLRGMLPSLRHLNVRCEYVRMVVFLAQVAPRLVSLKVELLPRLLPKFMECQFLKLESLTIHLNHGPRASVPIAAANKFLGVIQNLRKLDIFTQHDYSIFDLVFGMPSIEDLTLGGYLDWDWNHSPTILNGISRLTNLRSLRLKLQTSQYLILEQPLPSVESLKINGGVIRSNDLTTIFPNLKVLSCNSERLTDADAKHFVSTWRNTMEELTIRIDPATCQVLSYLCGLEKLRKITISFSNGDIRANQQEFIATLSAIAGLDTLQEMHLGWINIAEQAVVVKELRKFRHIRVISIDGYPIDC